MRVENDYLYTEWTHLWMTFLNGRVHPAWYRVFPVGSMAPEWKPMKSAAAVDKQTGVGEDDSDKDAEETIRENKGKVGAARKLPSGRYVWESRIRAGDKEVELISIEFDVARSPRCAGWG